MSLLLLFGGGGGDTALADAAVQQWGNPLATASMGDAFGNADPAIQVWGSPLGSYPQLGLPAASIQQWGKPLATTIQGGISAEGIVSLRQWGNPIASSSIGTGFVEVPEFLQEACCNIHGASVVYAGDCEDGAPTFYDDCACPS